MAVSFVGTIKRWQGLSTDDKPYADVPAGSTFDEMDTGRRFVWSMDEWKEDLASNLTTGKAIEINNEIRRIAEQTLLEIQAANRHNGIEVR